MTEHAPLAPELDPSVEIAIAAYLRAGLHRSDAAVHTVGLLTTLHRAEASAGILYLKHGDRESLCITLRGNSDRLASELADAINGVLARHAARAGQGDGGVGGTGDARRAA